MPLELLDQDSPLILIPGQGFVAAPQATPTDLVVQGWNQASEYADAAFNGAQAHIARLTAIGGK